MRDKIKKTAYNDIKKKYDLLKNENTSLNVKINKLEQVLDEVLKLPTSDSNIVSIKNDIETFKNSNEKEEHDNTSASISLLLLVFPIVGILLFYDKVQTAALRGIILLVSMLIPYCYFVYALVRYSIKEKWLEKKKYQNRYFSSRTFVLLFGLSTLALTSTDYAITAYQDSNQKVIKEAQEVDDGTAKMADINANLFFTLKDDVSTIINEVPAIIDTVHTVEEKDKKIHELQQEIIHLQKEIIGLQEEILSCNQTINELESKIPNEME